MICLISYAFYVIFPSSTLSRYSREPTSLFRLPYPFLTVYASFPVSGPKIGYLVGGVAGATAIGVAGLLFLEARSSVTDNPFGLFIGSL